MQKETRIVFMGTPEFATTILKKVVDEGYQVVGCVTVPDKPAGRGQKISESHVKQYAKSVGLTILQPEKLKSPEFIHELKGLNADLFIVVAFRMLPEVIWSIPPLGTINLHGSLLPQYRGAAPINWAIINGEQKTGVTSFFINEKIDTGDILLQAEMPINKNDTAGDIHDKMMHLGADVVVKTIEGLKSNSLKPTKQSITNESELKSAPKIFKEDCKINLDQGAITVHNFIRGLSPFPGAWTKIKHKEREQVKTLKIYKTIIPEEGLEIIDKTTFPKLLETNKKLFLVLKDGAIEILSLQLEGKKRLDSKVFLSGFNPEEWTFTD